MVWSLRTVHSGNALRLKAFPGIKLSTWLENRLPPWVWREEEKERLVMFIIYGLDSDHLNHYIDDLATRDYMIQSWKRSQFGPEAHRFAAEKDLELIDPKTLLDRFAGNHEAG